MKRSLVVKLTQGAEAPETANQAFTVAATALATGVGVSVWLTGEAAWFGMPDGADDLKLAHATPLSELRATVLAGGTLTVCSQCAARRGLVEADLVEGARVAGAASFAEEVLQPDVQALVY